MGISGQLISALIIPLGTKKLMFRRVAFRSAVHESSFALFPAHIFCLPQRHCRVTVGLTYGTCAH